MQSALAKHLLPVLLLAILFGALGARSAAAQCVNGNACNDNSACTTDDTCVDGVCIGTAITCADDGNLCTTTVCNAALGCQHLNNAAVCDDGNLCTTGDFCSGGSCRAGSPRNCSDGNLCTTDQCTPATGACFYTNNTVSCNDGNLCTTGDVCAAGACQPGSGALSCDDANGCTTDACNPFSGCTHANTANGTGCNDGSLCTTTDRCSNGACLGDPITCSDDTNACTTATCNPAVGCQQVNNTAACEDGDLCTVGDACSSGSCRSGGPKNCGDGNVCTTDQCTPATGACFYTGNNLPCNDGNACTNGDLCAGGSCLPGSNPLPCSDGNACTTDACNPTTGCVFPNAPNGTTCSDGSICTTGDGCTNGTCGGTAIVCPDDTNDCTTASCHPATGCGQANNSLPCDDANPCSLGDVCSGGSCVSGAPRNCSDANECTTDQCNERDGSCDHVDNDSICNDGDPCSQNDRCSNGSCQPAGPPLECDIGNNPCQIGSCDEVLGCVFTNAPPGTGCSDTNVCTTGDACSNGICTGTPIAGCNPAAVPSMSFWGRITLATLLALTALVASTRRARPPVA